MLYRVGVTSTSLMEQLLQGATVLALALYVRLARLRRRTKARASATPTV